MYHCWSSQILQYGVLAGSLVLRADTMARGELGAIIRTQLDPGPTLEVVPNG